MLGYRFAGGSSFDSLFDSPGGSDMPVISSSTAIQEAFGRLRIKSLLCSKKSDLKYCYFESMFFREKESEAIIVPSKINTNSYRPIRNDLDVIVHNLLRGIDHDRFTVIVGRSQFLFLWRTTGTVKIWTVLSMLNVRHNGCCFVENE